MTLYEINQQMEEAINRMFAEANTNDGEVSQETTDLISELQIARDDKLEALGCVIKNTKAEAKAIKEEIDQLTKRKKSLDNKVNGLNFYVAKMLNGEKWECPKVSFSFKKSEQVIIDDENKLARKWFRKKITFDIDKAAIKEAIKSGKSVRHARIAEFNNLQVK